MKRSERRGDRKPNHIVSIKQFHNLRILNRLFALADKLQHMPPGQKPLSGKTLATIFFEPSTRTRLSFEIAMYKMGGNVLTTENAQASSSSVKGESLPDTIRTIANYADAIVLRHPEKDAAHTAAQISPVPIINAGDGAGEHPTQALLDLYTLKQRLGVIKNLKIAITGDLLYSRTAHSLMFLLSLYKNTEVFLVSPRQLRLPAKYKNNLRIHEVESLREVTTALDAMYITRIQKERFKSKQEYKRLNQTYQLNPKNLECLKKRGVILSPLPRNQEIPPEIDTDPRAAYFEQAQNGVYVRMALLHLLLKNG